MNTHEENNLNFDRNFNRIQPPHTPETRGDISQGNPHPLYNKILESGYYCTECKQLCKMYEQGLSCFCGQPWETEVLDPRDYPNKWHKAKIWIEIEL